MRTVTPQSILIMQQLNPSPNPQSKEQISSTSRIPLVPETTLKLKNLSHRDLEGLQSMLGPRRPMTAFYGNNDPSQLQSTPLWHRENKGLRSEEKFKKYIENVRNLRQTSEALLHKNSEAMEIMHERPVEEPDLSDFMEKNYLRAYKKDKASQFEFTKKAEAQIQEKRFKSMRKTLEEINHEKKSGRKIIKYITDNSVDPANLALPRFVPHESKIQQNTQSASQNNNNLSLERAMQNLADLQLSQAPNTPSLYRRQETFEYKKDQLKLLKENINSIQRSFLIKRPLVIDTEKEETSPQKTPSQWKSQPKSAHSSKYKSKKDGIERRIKAQKPLEDFLKASAPETEGSQKEIYLASPLKFDFSASKLSMNISNRDQRGSVMVSPAIFEHTESDPFNSRMTSPLIKYPNAEAFTLTTFEEDHKDFIFEEKHLHSSFLCLNSYSNKRIDYEIICLVVFLFQEMKKNVPHKMIKFIKKLQFPD